MKEEKSEYEPTDLVLNMAIVMRGDILKLKKALAEISKIEGINIIYQKVGNNKFIITEKSAED